MSDNNVIFEIKNRTANRLKIFGCKKCLIGFVSSEHDEITAMKAHLESEQHQISCQNAVLPAEKVLKKIRNIVDRNTIIDIRYPSSAYFACVHCKVSIKRSKSKVEEHINMPCHIEMQERVESELADINHNHVHDHHENGGAQIDAMAMISESNGLYTITERTQQNGKVLCNLCNQHLTVRWKRTLDIDSHKKSSQHDELFKLYEANSHLPFEDLRILCTRKRFEKLVQEVRATFDICEADETKLSAVCRVCKGKITTTKHTSVMSRTVKTHLESKHHTNCIPKEDGYSPNEFMFNFVQLFMARKYYIDFEIIILVFIVLICLNSS